MNILLLGGSGGIGSYVHERLAQQHTVHHTYAHHPTPGGIKYNIVTDTLQDIIAEQQYDLIINNINPGTLSYTLTAKLAEELITFCKASKIKLINISSLFADDRNRYRNSYSMKKHLTDEIIIAELETSGYTILRYPQIFDYVGLGKKSQGGLYFIVQVIQKSLPLQLFVNVETMIRNYMPVDLLVSSLEYAITNNITGVHNIYIPAHTRSFAGIIRSLASFSGTYHFSTLATMGTKEGEVYDIPALSADYTTWANQFKDHNYYLGKLYHEYKG
jgi:nucleoside-diphosphate-sugar epimerase